MQYDTQWTPQERARVEALRLLLPRLSRAGSPDEVTEMAGKVAAFIAGPEAKLPYPWDQAAEAYRKLHAIITANGTRNEWSAPETIEVPVAELRAIRALLTEEPPF